jgi:diaminopimelate epimerase
MQGVGNDFVVIDGRDRDLDWEATARFLCDRRFGVGADGLLVLDHSTSSSFRMRMHNPDGSPDVCGNGMRCLARYAMEHGIVCDDTMTIETLAGPRSARILGSSEAANVTVDMGEPRFSPAEIPMLVSEEPVMNYCLDLGEGEQIRVTALSTGSTHCVAFVDSLPEDETFLRISPRVEHHPLFPERTSLMWCAQETPLKYRLRIWERGAGETWGCGTGACAAAVAAVITRRAPAGEPLEIVSMGGTLTVRWTPGGSIEMTGPAVTVYSGVVAVPC